MSDISRRTLRQKHGSIARHGRLKRGNPWLVMAKILAATLSVALVSGVSVAGIWVWQLDRSIKTVTLVGETEGPPPALGSFEGGFNILIVGSDQCEDPNGCKNRSGVLNDVTILLHVAQDQSHAVAVSFPRDLVVPIPSCPAENGGNHNAMSAQPINVTLSYGGLPCTVLTVENLTGLDIQFAGMITFSGVAAMASAVGGVTVCIDGPINDPRANGLNLPTAGEHTLEGWQALGFLRTRYGVGDGSDLGRISNQQVYMSALVRTLKADGVLNDFGKLFNIATVASQTMTLSNSLKNVNTMVSMAQVLKNLPLERVMFVQYPGVTGQDGVYSGKVAPVKSAADALFAKIRADEPFALKAGNTGRGSVLDPNAPAPTEPSAPVETAAPTDPSATPAQPAQELEVLAGIHGQSAADHTCSKSN